MKNAVTSPLVRMVDIHKSFGEVTALNGVNFQVGYNEIVGLVGDNGAGKSTLIKILTGVYAPDKGVVYFKGEKVEHYSESNKHYGEIFLWGEK